MLYLTCLLRSPCHTTICIQLLRRLGRNRRRRRRQRPRRYNFRLFLLPWHRPWHRRDSVHSKHSKQSVKGSTRTHTPVYTPRAATRPAIPLRTPRRQHTPVHAAGSPPPPPCKHLQPCKQVQGAKRSKQPRPKQTPGCAHELLRELFAPPATREPRARTRTAPAPQRSTASPRAFACPLARPLRARPPSFTRARARVRPLRTFTPTVPPADLGKFELREPPPPFYGRSGTKISTTILSHFFFIRHGPGRVKFVPQICTRLCLNHIIENGSIKRIRAVCARLNSIQTCKAVCDRLRPLQTV